MSDDALMRQLLAAVPVMGSLSLAGCSAGSSVQFETQAGRVLVKAAAESSEAYQAIISGQLSVLEGGCIGLSNDGVSYVAVFPAGTTLIEEGVAVPGIGEFEFGEAIRSQGGAVPRNALIDSGTEWIDLLPGDCPSDQIYMFTP